MCFYFPSVPDFSEYWFYLFLNPKLLDFTLCICAPKIVWLNLGKILNNVATWTPNIHYIRNILDVLIFGQKCVRKLKRPKFFVSEF